ncbi:ISWI ATPase, partial [Spelaeornis formosus]|nr:ISWI ATPase [Elachura formosa]
VPLTEEEVAEKEALAEEGFPDWQRRHFQSFIKAVEKYGRDNLDKVALEIADKTEEEVREYAKVFFERFSEVENSDRLIERIEAGEAKLREQQERIDALHKKVRSCNYPMQELKLAYGQNKGKTYSEEEDRFLLVRMHHHGIDRDDCYELVKRDIGEWPLFRFDWFFKSRTPEELKRRGHTLMLCIMKDAKPADDADFKPTGGAAGAAKGKKRTVDELKASAAGSRDTTPSVSGKKTNKKQKV